MGQPGTEDKRAVGHRKTCKRFNGAGHAHALTFSCFRRQPFLSRERSCRWFLEAVDRARDKHAFHGTPVRRGLCEKPEDWLWSSAADYAGIRVGPLRLDRESLPVFREPI